MSSMFCYQCEQAGKGTGCTEFGACGKDPETAALQDLLIYAAQGVSHYAHLARTLEVTDRDADIFVVEALFSTITNVNFDVKRLEGILRKAAQVKEGIRKEYLAVCKGGHTASEVTPPAAALWKPAADLAGLIAQGEAVGIEKRTAAVGADVAGTQDLILLGLKGVAAYADHALVLGKEDETVYAFIHEAMNFLTRPDPSMGELLGMALKVGEINLRVMELLDAANTGTYGTPTPTAVRVNPVKGKAIVVSGHDLKDLELLLKQTEGKGINVYTHGEMLPAHGYPELKKYKHLVGNYGGAWQDQRKEFDAFPGSILMTTNCIQKPRDTYHNRIFTSGLVAWPEVVHISDGNFKPVIDAALAAPGFDANGPDQTILVGFGHGTVLGVAGTVIDAVKTGALKRFYLIGGCDGAKSGRNYYTDFAQAVPKDCIILTLACGKFRFNKLDFGTLGGLPRLLDMGQCNDAYSAIKVAVALAGAFNCTVNDLPLSLILSWYEQKAVCILLTLLHLGVKNIRLGPSLPAFVTPAVLNVLVEKFAIKPITTVEADMKATLAGN